MRTTMFFVALVWAIFTATEASAVPLPKPRPNIVDIKSPVLCLAYVVYKEARGEPEEGQLMVAFVTKMRSWLQSPGFGGRSIWNVANAKGQYQGVKRNERFVVIDEKAAWQRSVDVAKSVLAGHFVPKGELRFATYYLNPKTADLKGKCWFAKNLIAIKASVESEHVFYREPLPKERILLGLAMPDECMSASHTNIASR